LVEEIDGVNDFYFYKEEFQNSISTPITKIVIDFSFFFGIIALIILIVSISFYLRKTFLEQKKEIGVYLSFGAFKKQILSILLFEMIILIMITSILGSLLGVFSLIFLFPIVISIYHVGIVALSATLGVLLLVALLGVIQIIASITVSINTSWNVNRIIKSIKKEGVN